MAIKTFPSFELAKSASQADQSVSGVYGKDGTPVYFITGPDVPDEVMRRLAFEVREGRVMSRFETELLTLAEAGAQ